MSTSRTDNNPRPLPLWQRLKDRLVRYAAEPDDSPELKLRKLLGLSVYALGMVVWPTYGAIYLAIGARLPALICMLVACIQVLCFVGYIRLRNYTLWIVLLGSIHMLGFLGVHFAFGGFTSSPYLLVYALLVPLLAPFINDPRNTKYWVAAAMALMLIAGVGERFVSHGGLVSPGVLTLLTVSILLGFALFALVPALIYGQRTRAINQQLAEAREAQLAQKAEHLAQTQAALERQTATAEILKVIASSPSDVQPVLDAIVHSARRLVGGYSATAWQVQEDMLHLAAFTATDEAGAQALRERGAVPVATTHLAAPARSGAPQIVADTETEPGLSDEWREMTRRRGYRSMLGVPLLHQGQAIGLINVTRQAPGDFAPHIVELLQTFADQAVIAIENVRLFNETQEALQLQKASADVLGVISRSMGDAAPVLDAILDKCEQLIDDATGSSISLIGEDGMVHVKHFRLSRLALAFDASPAEADKLLQRLRTPPPEPLAGSTVERVLQAGRPLVYRDIANDPGVPERLFKITRLVRRSYGLIAMPLIKEGRGLGMIGVSRHRLDGFSDKEIALLQTFADQAVVAIENARLFNETKEALERQTATAEILKVIASSPADTQPIFDAIVQSAVRLCNGVYCAGLLVKDGLIHLVAHHNWVGDALAVAQRLFPMPVDTDHVTARAIAENRIIHLQDMQTSADVPATSRELAIATGYQTLLVVPMLQHGRAIGAIAVAKAEGPFSEREMALLATFADQAVIAIQNVRLFNETQEALERQTATSEVLNVISNSVADTAPVFDKILQSCEQLFPASFFNLFLVDEAGLLNVERMHATATARAELGGDMVAALETTGRSAYPRPVDDTAAGELFRSGGAFELRDALNDPHTTVGAKLAAQRMGRNYSSLSVPLMWEGRGIGMLTMMRFAVGAFPPKEHALLKTFADQAVIAIQNARLFNETQEALARQTATTNVLKAISRSTFDLAAVLDTLISTASRLCQAWMGVIFRVEGDLCHAAGLHGATPALIEHLQANPISLLDQDSVTSKAVALKAPYQVEDASDSRVYGRVDVQQVGGYRTLLAVPVLREGVAIGVLTLGRQEARLFNDKEIELVTSFADQAAIAMENVRLFNETKEALERQTATADILRVISESPTDVTPVFDAIAERARVLCGARLGFTTRFDGERLQLIGYCGVSAAGRSQDARRVSGAAKPQHAQWPMLPRRGSGADRRHAAGSRLCARQRGESG